MPTFDGLNIFGVGVQMETGDVELERQENKFAGISGIESLTQGIHGMVTSVKGLLRGADASLLAAAESTFRGYRNGVAYTLVDSYATSWNNVVCESFTPHGKILRDGRGLYRTYTATFKHLTTS